MKRIVLSLLVIIPLVVSAGAVFSMSKGSIEDVVICVVNKESHYVPSSLCEYYLHNYRLTEEDIRFLEDRAGLAFLFDVPDKEKRNALLEYFVAKGVSFNKPSAIDGYPPLHAAIISNDPELVAFLLEQGADVDQRDRNHNLTAEEFVDFLGQTQDLPELVAIKNLLSAHSRQGQPLEPRL